MDNTHDDPFSVENDPLDDVVQIDPNKDYFSDYVGEGKKYKDNLAAGRALVEKDAFIKKLLSETKGLRDELKTRTNFETLIDRLEKNGKSDPGIQKPDVDKPTSEDALTPDKIEQLLESRLSEREKAASKAQNYREVVSQVQEKFGANAKQVIATKAEELGVGIDFLKSLAEDKPKAFLALLGDPKPTESDLFAGPPRSQVNTSGTTERPSVGGHKTKAYYDKIFRDNRNQYWTTEVQVQMHKDAMALGQEFYR